MVAIVPGRYSSPGRHRDGRARDFASRFQAETTISLG
jgi:hypothetical protein